MYLIYSSNNSNGSETLRDFLQQSKPEFIRVVPNHWLDQTPPVHDTQITISILLLFIYGCCADMDSVHASSMAARQWIVKQTLA